jgi:hypothetical protein
MSSVSLPCPSCSVPLILDEENAGSEVLCPGCNARLHMPATVSAKARLTLLSESTGGPDQAAPPAADHGAKAALPMSRAKSAEEERKRLAAAAAAAGAAHSFKPEEAGLPEDHRRVTLPTKRNLPLPAEAPKPTPSGGTGLPPAASLPAARKADPATEEPAAKSAPNLPRVTGHEEIGSAPTRGPSRFVRAVATDAEVASSAAIPASEAAAAEALAPEDGDSDNSPAARGGFRLGASRELHFSPIHASNGEADAAAWGAKAETELQAARGRRFASLAVLLAILAAGGVGIYVWRQALARPQQAASLTDDGNAAATAASADDVMRNVEDARRVLKRFLEADSVEKMAAEVRHPQETQPRMERYYAANPLKPRKIRSESQSWSEIRVENTEFIRAAMELDDFIVYPVTLEIVPGGEPKVDWESFVSWAEIPWKDFLRKPPEQSLDYRVTATIDARDQYYNYSFKGRELDLLCFKLEDPGKYGSCWAYCDKDSEAASKLLFNLKRSRQQGIVNDEGKTAIRCILRLRFPPEGMKTNQVMIEAFLHDSWVQP